MASRPKRAAAQKATVAIAATFSVPSHRTKNVLDTAAAAPAAAPAQDTTEDTAEAMVLRAAKGVAALQEGSALVSVLNPTALAACLHFLQEAHTDSCASMGVFMTQLTQRTGVQ
jgi:hypothetical protein